jgi:hypothetical protein
LQVPGVQRLGGVFYPQEFGNHPVGLNQVDLEEGFFVGYGLPFWPKIWSSTPIDEISWARSWKEPPSAFFRSIVQDLEAGSTSGSLHPSGYMVSGPGGLGLVPISFAKLRLTKVS